MKSGGGSAFLGWTLLAGGVLLAWAGVVDANLPNEIGRVLGGGQPKSTKPPPANPQTGAATYGGGPTPGPVYVPPSTGGR